MDLLTPDRYLNPSFDLLGRWRKLRTQYPKWGIPRLIFIPQLQNQLLRLGGSVSQRLTTMEKRAADVFTALTKENPLDFVLEWKQNSVWGLCPAVIWRGFKLSYASGSGYCKQSAALADAIRFIFPKGTPEHNSIHSLGGCGLNTLTNQLNKLGFELECLYHGQREESYRLSKTQ